MPTFWKPTHFPLTEVFIETGTNRGDSLAAALATGYSCCLSVEFVDNLYRFAKQRFASEPRAKLFHGSSPEMLPRMIDPAKTTTFWLDAHFSGNDLSWQDTRYGECPLLQELQIIMAAPWRQSPFICIDDAFAFRESAWQAPSEVFVPALFTRSHWPVLSEIHAILTDFEIREANHVLFCRKLT